MTRDTIAVLVAAPLLALPTAKAAALDLHCKIGEPRGKIFGSLGYNDYPDIDRRAYLAEHMEFFFDIDLENKMDRNRPSAEVQVKTVSISISDDLNDAWNKYGVSYQHSWTIDRTTGEFMLMRLVRREEDGWPFIVWTGECRQGRPTTRF